ncbi:MAG: peptidylprolyl isomerase [Sandaracinaceae bacterium]
MTHRALLALTLSLSLAACGEDAPDPAPSPAPGPAEVAEVEEPASPELTAPADPNEACARVVVVAWQGAMAAGDEITRSEEDARARAEELRGRLEQGEDMAALARADSDASSSGPRGGLLGTYTRDDFPAVHTPIRDAVFNLQVHQTSEVVRAPYGFVVARRCPVEKVTTRHILIRYAGARNAGDDITRTEAEARAEAENLRTQIEEGADFADIAREHSEDGSADNGGLIGSTGRGLLQPEYEEAAYALEINAVSQVVETAFGFHLIQRLPDEG